MCALFQTIGYFLSFTHKKKHPIVYLFYNDGVMATFVALWINLYNYRLWYILGAER